MKKTAVSGGKTLRQKTQKKRTEAGISLKDDESGPMKLSLKDDDTGPLKLTLKDDESGPLKLTLRDDVGSSVRGRAPQKVEDLGLSPRTFKFLEQEALRTVKALTKKRPVDLLAIQGFGQKALGEVRKKLGVHGFTLRGDVEGFTPHGDVEGITLQPEPEPRKRRK